MAASFAGAPDEIVSEFNNTMGVTFQYGGTVASPLVSVFVLLGTTVLFFGLSMMNMSKKAR